MRNLFLIERGSEEIFQLRELIAKECSEFYSLKNPTPDQRHFHDARITSYLASIASWEAFVKEHS